jgi:hypothetical protein
VARWPSKPLALPVSPVFEAVTTTDAGVGVDWEETEGHQEDSVHKRGSMGWPFAVSVLAATGSGARRVPRLCSLRPPNVSLGETRQLCRILVAFTLPTLGEASSMSKTFAVSRYACESSSSAPIDTPPALRSRFSCARSTGRRREQARPQYEHAPTCS